METFSDEHTEGWRRLGAVVAKRLGRILLGPEPHTPTPAEADSMQREAFFNYLNNGGEWPPSSGGSLLL